MKLILQRDVAKIGKRFATVDVPQGYALNHLIPTGAGVPATTENQKRIDAQKNRSKEKDESSLTQFKAACEALTGGTVTLEIDASDQGHLFEGLTKDKIADHLAQKGHVLAADTIELKAPLKDLGEHAISISLGDTSATFTLELTAKK
jgi:large subunit ribosomal protein L9